MNRQILTAWAVVLSVACSARAQEPMLARSLQPAGASSQLWLRAEYLLWWLKSAPAPVPLVTTAPPTSTAATPGALGNPDTVLLLGGGPVHHAVHHGGRFTLGLWLDERAEVGVESSYFFLADRSVQEAVADGGSGTLTNPFFDTTTGSETGNFLAFAPLGTAGGAIMTNRSRMQGAEINLLRTLFAADSARVCFLAGFRYLQLQEGLTLTTVQTDPSVAFFPGQFVSTVDEFSTRNNFYGGQVGGRLDLERGRFFLQTTAKLALGNTDEIVAIQGFTNTNTGPGFASAIPVTTVPGGIYAQPTNIGVHHRNRFAVAPEITIQLGMTLGERARLFVGYNFLYISEVVRPGNQIDRTINSTQLVSFNGVPSPLVGVPRPTPLLNGSEFWAQGINFGVEFGW